MKAEHRKELQTNALADYLGNVLQKAKEGPSQVVLLYGGLTLLVVVLIGVFIWYAFGSKDKDAERWVQWNEMTETTAPGPNTNQDEIKKLQAAYPNKSPTWIQRLYELNKFEADNPNTPQARLARFQKARLLMDDSQAIGSGLNLQRETVLKTIAEGRDLYEKLINEASDEPLLMQQAILNAAKANEDLGQYDRAKQLYERLQKDFPKSMFAPEVEKALARLQNSKDLDQLKKLAEK